MPESRKNSEQPLTQGPLVFTLLTTLLAVVYYGAARLGLAMAFSHEQVSPIWPPTGLAVAALLIGGPRMWVGVFIGAFWINWQMTPGELPRMILSSLAIGSGNTLEAVTAYYLIRRFAGENPLRKVGTSLIFFICAGVVAPVVSASIGILTLYITGTIPTDALGYLWMTWYIGDMGGALLVAPVIWVLWGKYVDRTLPERPIELVVILTVLVLAGHAIFYGWVERYYLAQSYLALPILFWAVFRHREYGTALSVLFLTWPAVTGTISGSGPFDSFDPNQSLLQLQLFLAVVAVTNFLINAVLSEYEKLQEQLTESNRELEERVAERLAEREQVEKELRHIQKMDALETLAGGIAHDFNNILGSIVGYAELAEMSLDEPEAVEKHLSGITHAADRARALVDHIMQLSQKTERRIETVQVEKIAGEVAGFVTNSLSPGIRVVTRVEGAIPPVKADSGEIYQVIMNLATNAGTAMQSTGGKLDITTGVRELSSEQVPTGVQAGRFVFVELKDTGPGIAPEVMERMYDPFYTTGELSRGSGLGLSIVDSIVRNMGGAIQCYSKEGRGTTFTVYFPVSLRTGKKVLGGTKRPLPKIPDGLTILLVDDEPDLLATGAQALKHHGIEVVTAGNGRIALEIFSENPYQFAGVITDQTMPEISGEELATQILAVRPEIPVLLVSGFGHRLDRERMETMGVKLLRKPISWRTVIEVLTKNLARP